MSSARSHVTHLFVVVVIALVPLFALAADNTEPVAQMVAGGTAVEWQIARDHEKVNLVVMAPDGTTFTKEFPAGAPVTFRLQDMGKAPIDGAYSFDVRLVPHISAAVKAELARLRAVNDSAGIERVQREAGIAEQMVQSGVFTVRNGVVMTPSAQEGGNAPGRSRIISTGAPTKIVTNDQVIADDLIVQGSICAGFDCVNGESFGFDTLRLKENNTRIKFDDTSTSAGCPNNDWQLTANDACGGANKFSIEDITGAKVPFTITAGAPTNSVFVASTGKVGFRNSSPGLDLHMTTGDTPAVRFEQTNASGFTAQTWDIGANEANFFVRDLTGGSRLSFRIRPGAPTSSIDIAASGNVGIGTASPSQKLHVATTTNGPIVASTDGKLGVGSASPTAFVDVTSTGSSAINTVTQARLIGTGSATWSGIHFGDGATADGFVGYLSGSSALLGFANNAAAPQVVISSAGNIGVGTTTPTNPIEHSSGARLTSGGTWTNASSRALKQDIVDLQAPEAFKALECLEPVKYSYKVDPSEHHVGFIAEDVPELVATTDHKSLSPMDIVAVLTKVAKEQQKTIEGLKARIDQLEKASAKQN